MVGPRLLALLLCHDVTRDDDGRPVLRGLYDRVVLRSLPGADECVVYTKYVASPGEHDLMLAVVDLESGRETGRALHQVTVTGERPARETTWRVTLHFERIGHYVIRFLIDGELVGFTTVEAVAYPS
jgi:hypothetical protein